MTSLTPGSWTLDAAHSDIGLKVRHAGISTVRATFAEAEGTLSVGEDGALDVEAVVNPASFDSKNPDRDAHVRSADFLDVETYPEATFRTGQFRAEGEEFEVTGELTLHGVTKSVTFDVEFGGQAVDPFGATRAGLSATTTVSRKDFGLTWNAALEAGGVLVSDKVTLTLDVAFVLNAS